MKTTIVLMIAVLLGFLVGEFLYLTGNPTFYYLIQVNYLVLRGDYLSLLTSIFVTNSFPDFFFNFFSLGVIYYLFGSRAGKFEYLVFLLSGLVGNVFTLFFFPPFTASEGASGGIFGVFAFYVIEDMVEMHRVDYNGLGILVFVFILSDVIPHVNFVAHLGGIFTGVLLALATPHLLKRGGRA